jgi:flagellar basal body rod protein FlgC
MYELMQTMSTNITNLATQSATQYTQLRSYIDERFTSCDRQIADLRTYIHGQYGEHQTYMSGQFGDLHTEMTQLGSQMGRMNVQYSDLAEDIDEIAEHQHGTYHRTDRIFTHMSSSGFVSADPIPRRRRHRRTPPLEDGAPPQQD